VLLWKFWFLCKRSRSDQHLMKWLQMYVTRATFMTTIHTRTGALICARLHKIPSSLKSLNPGDRGRYFRAWQEVVTQLCLTVRARRKWLRSGHGHHSWRTSRAPTAAAAPRGSPPPARAHPASSTPRPRRVTMAWCVFRCSSAELFACISYRVVAHASSVESVWWHACCLVVRVHVMSLPPLTRCVGVRVASIPLHLKLNTIIYVIRRRQYIDIHTPRPFLPRN
jgi:hypothetical protein